MTDKAESQTDEQRAEQALLEADFSGGKRVAVIAKLIRQSRAEGVEEGRRLERLEWQKQAKRLHKMGEAYKGPLSPTTSGETNYGATNDTD